MLESMRTLFQSTFPFRPARLPIFYGWWILVVSSLGIVASIPGQTMGFSVFTPILSEELGLSLSSISTAYLIGTVLAGLFLPQVGRWFDQLGARVMGTLACVVMGCGLLYLSQVDAVAQLASSQIPALPPHASSFAAITVGFFGLRFTGQGTLTMTCRSMLGKWFNSKRGLALSISGIVVSFSFSIAPRVLDLGIEHLGWRETWWIMGCGLITGIAAFVWLFFRDNPESCGLHMDGIPPDQVKEETHEDLIIYREFTRAEALRTVPFWIFNLVIGLHSFVVTGYTFHVVAIAEDLAIPRATILAAFVPASLLGIAISLFLGWISSRVRLKYLLAVLTLGGFLFSLGPAFRLPGTEQYLILGLGLSSGTFGILSGMVWPRFFGRKHLGAISGVNMATMVYGSAAAPLCFSLCHDLLGSFQTLFMLTATLYAVASVSTRWADNPQRRLKPSLPPASQA